MHPDTNATSEADDQLTPSFIARLLVSILATIPSALTATPADKAELQAFVRTLFAAFHARSPIEAALAGRAITAWFAAMDLYARAARTGLADDAARRLRGTANATGRLFDAALRERARRQPRLRPAQPAAAPPQPWPQAPTPPSATPHQAARTTPNRAPTADPRLDPKFAPAPRPANAKQSALLTVVEQAIRSASRGENWRAGLQTSVALPPTATTTI
jgi:hypothetical protein